MGLPGREIPEAAAPSGCRIAGAFIMLRATSNVTGHGMDSHQWGAQGRLIGVNSNISYVYNALGERVEKQVGTAYTEYAYDASGTGIGASRVLTRAPVKFRDRKRLREGRAKVAGDS